MVGDRSHHVIWPDAVGVAHAQAETYHPALMRNAPGVVRKRTGWPANWAAAFALPVIAARSDVLYLADRGNRPLFFIAARQLQCGRGDLQRVMPFLHQPAHQLTFPGIAGADKPDFETIKQFVLAVAADVFLAGQVAALHRLADERLDLAQQALLAA